MSECKRCGDEENRIDGFCSIYCRDLHAAEAEPPPPTEAIVLEGEIQEAMRPGGIEFWTFDLPDDWIPPDDWPEPEDYSIRVKVTIEPLEGEGDE